MRADGPLGDRTALTNTLVSRTALTKPIRSFTPDLSHRPIDLPAEDARIDRASPAPNGIDCGPALVLLLFVDHQAGEEFCPIRRRQGSNPLCQVVHFSLRSLHRRWPLLQDYHGLRRSPWEGIRFGYGAR